MVEIPPEVVEIILMETFHWTPNQIDEIPYARVQQYFMILNQRRITQQQRAEFEEKKRLHAEEQEKNGLRLRKEL